MAQRIPQHGAAGAEGSHNQDNGVVENSAMQEAIYTFRSRGKDLQRGAQLGGEFMRQARDSAMPLTEGLTAPAGMIRWRSRSFS